MTREQFTDAFTPVQEPLRRFLLTLCEGDAFTADDIVQDACVKAYLACDRFRGAAKFSTWLFGIAYHCWCDRRYDRRTTDSVDASTIASTVADDTPADTPSDTDRHDALYRAIDGLKPNEKAAILLFYMEDRSIKEIASIMDIPSGTVRSLLSRGRSNLKMKLQCK